jgi:hypothetical protein
MAPHPPQAGWGPRCAPGSRHECPAQREAVASSGMVAGRRLRDRPIAAPRASAWRTRTGPACWRSSRSRCAWRRTGCRCRGCRCTSRDSSIRDNRHTGEAPGQHAADDAPNESPEFGIHGGPPRELPVFRRAVKSDLSSGSDACSACEGAGSGHRRHRRELVRRVSPLRASESSQRRCAPRMRRVAPVLRSHGRRFAGKDASSPHLRGTVIGSQE